MQSRIAPERVHCLRLEPARTYPLRYAGTLIKHMARRRPLRLEDVGVWGETEFEVPKGHYDRWLDLFGVSLGRSLSEEEDPGPLFSLNSIADTFLLFALARRLGVPFRNILHARTTTRRLGPLNPGQRYSARSVYRGAEPRRNGSALLRFDTTIEDGVGEVVVEAENSLFLRGVPQERWSMLRPVERPTELRRRRRTLNAPDWEHDQDITPDLGRGFGLVSGDLNPMHTMRWLARLFGHRTGFIQGMCAYNLTAAALRERIPMPLTALSMTFSRPFYVGEQARLLVQGDEFEWVNAQDKVMGYGSFQTRATTPVLGVGKAVPWHSRSRRHRPRTISTVTVDPALGIG